MPTHTINDMKIVKGPFHIQRPNVPTGAEIEPQPTTKKDCGCSRKQRLKELDIESSKEQE